MRIKFLEMTPDYPWIDHLTTFISLRGGYCGMHKRHFSKGNEATTKAEKPVTEI
jgi:hypothetical protein